MKPRYLGVLVMVGVNTNKFKPRSLQSRSDTIRSFAARAASSEQYSAFAQIACPTAVAAAIGAAAVATTIADCWSARGHYSGITPRAPNAQVYY